MTLADERARPALQQLQTYKPGTPIEDVKRKYKLSSVIKLASNENALGPSPKAVSAIRGALGELHRYPDATCHVLRQALAKKLRVPPDWLVFGNGSDELLVLALRAFVDPGEEVLVAEPTFQIYEIQSRACGAKVTVVPLRDFRYDLREMKAASGPATKLVFIANPDNPTGSYVTRRELETFLQDLPRQVLVVLDEAYCEFVDAPDYPQSLRYVADRPVLVTRTFSKAYGLAGLRVGYGIAQPSVIRALDAVREPFNVNRLAQAAGTAALQDTGFLRRSRDVLRQGRRYLERELKRLKLRHVPSVTNFMLIELGPRAPDIVQALLERGVIVRDMRDWKLSGFLRVTIGTMPENRRFIAALRRCLAGHRAR